MNELNFTIGENFGKLLTSIAREKVLYDFNLEKGLLTLTGSLIGLEPKTAMDIISGTKDLEVDGQDVLLVDGKDPLDWRKWIRQHHAQIKSQAKSMRAAMSYYRRDVRQGFEAYIDAGSLVDYLNTGEVKGILSDVLQEEKILGFVDMARVILTFIEKTDKFIALTYALNVTRQLGWDLEVSGEYSLLKTQFSNLDFQSYELQEDGILERYVEAHKVISKELEDGLKPADTSLTWDAGLISPDGVYYALNGEIANMLHNTMATALYEAGIIPESIENKENPLGYLMQNGWLKHTKDWVLYDGYLNERISLRNIPIKRQQLKTLVRAAMGSYRILKLGYNQYPVTPIMLMGIDPLEFELKYFTL